MSAQEWAEEKAREIALKVSGVSPDEHSHAICDLMLMRRLIAAALVEARAEGERSGREKADKAGVELLNKLADEIRALRGKP